MFDCAPPPGEILVSLGQSPNTVQVVGENDDGFDIKRSSCPGPGKGLAQQADIANIVKQRPALIGDNGEEIAAAGDAGTSVILEKSVETGLNC